MTGPVSGQGTVLQVMLAEAGYCVPGFVSGGRLLCYRLC